MLHDVVLRYVFIETMVDVIAYERLLSRYDPRARYVSAVLNAVDFTRFRVDEIAKHVPQTRFMCLAITVDRRYSVFAGLPFVILLHTPFLVSSSAQ